MADFESLLHREYGLKPQVKLAPMATAKGVTEINAFGGSKEKSRVAHSAMNTASWVQDGFQAGIGKDAISSGRSSERLEDNLFRVTPLSTGSKIPVQTSMPLFDDIDDMGSKPRLASPAKGYLPVFDVVPTYDNDIFGGAPGAKRAMAGLVYDDIFNGGAANSAAASHVDIPSGRSGVLEQASKPSSHASSTSRRTNPRDVSSNATNYGNSEALSELNTVESSRSRLGRHQAQYQRQSQQPFLAAASAFPHKPNKIDHLDNFPVDPVGQGNRQSMGTPVLDSLDALSSMTYHAKGGRNIPSKSKVSESVNRSKGDNAIDSSVQSATISTSSPIKPSRGFDLRNMENGNITSSPTFGRNGALEGRPARQHFHENSPSTDAVNISVNSTQSARKKSQYTPDLDRMYGRSPVKSKESLPGQLNQQAESNLGQIYKSNRRNERRDSEEVWLTVDNIRLVTKPTLAPPPSRSPPPFALNRRATAPRRKSKSNNKIFARTLPMADEEKSENPKIADENIVGQHAAKSPVSSVPSSSGEIGTKSVKAQLDSPNFNLLVRPEEQRAATAAGAPALDMTEAVKRAEALLKLGKELEEKEKIAKAAKEAEKEKENVVTDPQRVVGRKEPDYTDAKEREAEQRGSWRLREHQRAKDRSAFEMANSEVHEKAAADSRERTERAAVERVTVEVRERAVAAAARNKALTEARERAASEARAALEMREKAASEAREKMVAEAREKAAAEARENAAAKAREIAATEAREKAVAAEKEKLAAEAREKAAAEEREKVAAEAREKVLAEARERMSAEAREKMASEERERIAAEAIERMAAEARERAAVERAAAEARGRSERAAVQRANAEARERAAEKANAEARLRAAERAAAERAAAEARARAERAAVEKSSAGATVFASRDQHQRNENDLEQFFNMSRSRTSSTQKLRPVTPDLMNASRPDKVFPNKEDQRSSTSEPVAVKTSSTTIPIPDDWEPFFAASPSAEFQEIQGEAPDRRKVERQQKTAERMAKALADKYQRDLDVQREQVEKHRAAAGLDAEIYRWAAGKEGNLRALLSTLHYVKAPSVHTCFACYVNLLVINNAISSIVLIHFRLQALDLLVATS
ncbi:hypothetical protein O6H91_07G037300 [Diphasiastrum complanatum]|uniref:Uncharacterized protein n=1 Tax=Diphasiastrum complanatum TaxID=34168 RepID=A0ACC2D4U8_DIPCM|nr:hypothetical protein O6H91_07G037300 [Diphasiastrum complanatum]